MAGSLYAATDPWADVRRSIGRMKASPVDVRAAMTSNPNDPNPGPGTGGLGQNIAWGNVPGLEKFYSYDAQNNAENFDIASALPVMEQMGYQVMQGFDPESETSASWVVGPDGAPIIESARLTGTNDDRFKLAALAAMGVTGANVLGAGLGAGGASAAPGAGGAAAAEGGAGLLADYGVGAATLDSGAAGWGLTEAAAGAAGGGSLPALTGVDAAMADVAASGAITPSTMGGGMNWLDTALTAGKSVFGNDWLTTAMSLVGSGVNQYNIEKAAQDQRDWLDSKDTDRRRRQAPGALPAMKTTVYTKGGG